MLNKHDSMRGVQRMEQNFEYLGSHYQKYLKTDYTERIKKLEECIQKNFIFLCHIVHEQQFLFNFKQTVYLDSQEYLKLIGRWIRNSYFACLYERCAKNEEHNSSVCERLEF